MTILGGGPVPLGVRRVWGPPDRCLHETGECGRCMGRLLYHESTTHEIGATMCRCPSCTRVRSVYATARRVKKAAEKGLTIKPRPELRHPRGV